MRLITALFSIIAITAVNAQVPIPTRPPGFALGGPASAPIVLEAFFDLMCPDSAAAWPTIQQVVTHYNTNLHFLLHLFPLPYHTNSFFANQGAFVVSQTNASNVFTWTTAVFQNQEQFSNGATAGSSINDVISSMGDLAAKTGLISKSAFISGIGNADINWSQRVEWKYGCTRGVAGTPTFFINGVEVAASASWSLADWQSVLDPLVPTHRRHHKHVTETTNKALFACPSGEPQCQYLPGKFECCLPGEGCIPNVGCRC